MEIKYRAPDRVRAVIESLGRTEDVRFSPSNRRLAIAAFNRAVIAIVDIEIVRSAGVAEVALTGAAEIASPCLCYPHGLDFLDETTLAVANRQGDVAILASMGARAGAVSPIRLLGADGASFLDAPGSVSVIERDAGTCELLVCNNSGDSVTRHVIERGAHVTIRSSDVLLRKWLDLPDGVCVSGDRQWIAVSNHNTHGVLLYRYSPALNAHAKPDGVLRGVCFPHGLRFSPDGRHLFVADAGAPFVHVYAGDGGGWRGARSPAASVRIMDEPLFLRGRQNPQEGGPKGIDLDRGTAVLVATSEHQPLAFFDLPAILAGMPPPPPVLEVEYEYGILQQAERLRMRAIEAERRAAKAGARRRKRRSEWITAPLRRACSALWRLN